MRKYERLSGWVIATIIISSACTALAYASPLAPPPQKSILHFYRGQYSHAEHYPDLAVSSSMTIEAWIYLEDASHGGLLFGKEDRFNEYSLQLVGDPPQLTFFLKTTTGSAAVSDPGVPSLNAWTHIAGIYDGAKMELWVDGQKVNSFSYSGAIAAGTSDFRVGGEHSVGGFTGYLRQLRLWRRALTQSELTSYALQTLRGDENGLAACWPLDDGKGQHARNLTGGNPLILGPTEANDTFANDPNWRLADPFYLVREDLAPDLYVEPDPPPGIVISFAVADMNRDGLDDVIFNSANGNGVIDNSYPFYVLLNDGTGRFVESTNSVIKGVVPEVILASGRVLVAADLNGDGMTDFFSGNSGLDTLEGIGEPNTLLLSDIDGLYYDAGIQISGPLCNSPTPAFQGQHPCRQDGGDLIYPSADETGPPPLDFTHSAASGDIDGDGDVDIYVGNITGWGWITEPYFLINDGIGNFTVDWQRVPNTEMVSGMHNRMATLSLLSDMDGDGHVDLIIGGIGDTYEEGPSGESYNGESYIYWNDGSGDFSQSAATLIPNVEGYKAFNITMIATDIDGDGDKDLVLARNNEAGVNERLFQILINQGNRVFVDETATRIEESLSLNTRMGGNLREIDFNGDGCPDILHQGTAAYDAYDGGMLFLNDCTGHFSPVEMSVLGKPGLLLPLDAHGDGGLDFLVYLPNGMQYGTPCGDFALLEQVKPYAKVPDILVSPSSFAFGDVLVGLSGTQPISILNKGDLDLTVDSAVVLGPDAGMFEVVPGGSDPCGPFPLVLTPGSSCTMGVTFAPTSAEGKTATLRISSNDPEAPTTDVTLTGNGVPCTKVTLAQPNGGERFATGELIDVKWGAPETAVKFKLFYSLDKGVTWTAITKDFVTDTTYPWTVPALTANKKSCLVKVVGFNAKNVKVGSDRSDAAFSIEVVKLTYPDGGEPFYSGDTEILTWTVNATKNPVANIKLYYTKNSGTTWTLLATLAGNETSYEWPVPAVTKPKTKCKVKIVLKDAKGISLGSDMSDAFFTLAPPAP